MRKLFAVLMVCVLLLGLLAPTAMAQWRGVVLPDPAFVPHEVMPGDAEFAAAFGSSTFADLWVDVWNTPGHYEIPGSTQADNPYAGDDYLRGIFRNEWGDLGPNGDYSPTMVGFPIGFTFKFMQGPPDMVPGWRDYFGTIEEAGAMGWPSFLSDTGYTRAFVAINGFIVFDDPDVKEWVADVQLPDGTWQGHWVGMGQANWWPWQLPIVEPPNNFIAPYWTDLAVGDNRYFDKTKGYTISRPRGRILAVTVGTAPNRRWVVEWLNARNPWTGFLSTFELQLFEGSNAFLFLYKDFSSKGGPYFEFPSVMCGAEDYFGSVGVGQLAKLGGPPWANWLGFNIRDLYLAAKPLVYSEGFGGPLPAVHAAGDMVGFVY